MLGMAMIKEDMIATLANHMFLLDIYKEPDVVKLAAGSEKETEL